ncbi:MAG: EAL domain-containing protein [Steroidobacteraceae bacterium]
MSGVEWVGPLLTALAILLLAIVLVMQRRQVRGPQGESGIRDGAAPAAAGIDRAAVEALAASVSEPVFIHGERIEAVNEAFCALTGLAREQVIGRRIDEVVDPRYSRLIGKQLALRLAGGDAPEFSEVEIIDPFGQVTRLELKASTLEVGGERLALFAAAEIMRIEHEAPARVELDPRAQLALQSLDAALLVTDAAGRIEFANPLAEEWCGLPTNAMRGKRLGELVSFIDPHERCQLPDPLEQAIATRAGVALAGGVLLVTPSTATERWIEVRVSVLPGMTDKPAGAVVLMQVRQPLVAAASPAELAPPVEVEGYQSTHDPLTGLVNRRGLEQRLADLLVRDRDNRRGHVLCRVDIERLRGINDAHGREAGDLMLKELSRVMRTGLRESDPLGRVGGAQFALLLPGCPLDKGLQVARELARRIEAHRVNWKGQVLSAGATIGVLEMLCPAGSAAELLDSADAACYAARASGGKVQVRTVEDTRSSALGGEGDALRRLQLALSEDRGLLFVQPIQAASTGVYGGPELEVLLRFPDAEGHPVSPGEFIRAAERHQLLGQLDRWVVRRVLEEVAGGGIRLSEGRSVSVNLSGVTMADPAFLDYVVETLDRTGVSAERLCFEVGEAAVIRHLDVARRFIEVLHGMGCQFALDDFGNDVGSLAYLRSLAPDYIKIDGTFTRNLARDAVSRAMVSAVIGLSRTLRFRLVAEQVEDQAALDAVRGMGVEFAQGYAIARPQPLRPAA